MGAGVEISYDRSLLGVKHRIGSFEVTRDLIDRFTRAVDGAADDGDDGGDGDVAAPPTFCNVFISGFDRPDIKLEFGNLHLFASQAIECLGAVRAGDTLEGGVPEDGPLGNDGVRHLGDQVPKPARGDRRAG